MEIGTRLTTTVTGTVVEVNQSLKEVTETHPDHQFIAIKTDDGNAVVFELTDDSQVFQNAKPDGWPAIPGDGWMDETSRVWSAENVDFGYRKGLRMRSYDALGENLRSLKMFLTEHPNAELIFRNGESYGY